jgi:putative SOS response-associated peptidase YedK
MCGRFTLKTLPQLLAEHFALGDIPALAPRYNIAPSQEIAVVRLQEGQRRLDLLRWGLVPSWSKDASIGSRLINARSETAGEKPAFRAALRSRRCLVPADGFYEWQVRGGRKQPHLIQRRDGGPFAFAGLWERWRGTEGTEIASCTLLTTEANELVRPIHDRMPVILDPRDYEAWLDSEVNTPARVASLLRPSSAAEMVAIPVGLWVNDPRHDDPRCVDPEAT